MPHAPAHPGVADCAPIVNRHTPGTLVVPAIHIGHTDLELEAGGDPVHRLIRVAVRIDAVPVQIDEAGRYDQSRRIHTLRSREGLRAQGFDAPVAHTDIEDCVDTGFRIHDSAV